MVDGRVAVGRIMKAHGIRGEVSIEPLTDVPERFAPGASLMLDETTVTVVTSRPHQGRVLVKFEQVSDRTAAESLRGRVLEIDEAEVAPLDEWSFYPHQLEGLEVRDRSGTDLGTFLRVLESPGGDIWVVDADGKEVMVPAVRDVVVGVDLDGGVITLDPPDGLF